MRKLIASAFVSLDGVMQAPGGPDEDRSGGFEYGGWTFHHWDQVMGQAMDRLFAAPFDLLLGRKTYEIFAAHWPHAVGDPLADKFNAATKYVATASGAPLMWQHSIGLRDAANDVAQLKKQDGPVLLVQGSSDLMQTLLAHDLLDELTLLVFPVVLGQGKRFFGAGARPTGMKLVSSQIASTGVIIATYERGGAVTTGSFALE